VIRVVLDTNVLASGLVATGGTLAEVIQRWEVARFDLVVSHHILEELERTLAKPYFRRERPADWARTQIDAIRRRSWVVGPTAAVAGLASHASDDPIIATVIHGEADLLVTGDRALLDRCAELELPALTPAGFLQWLSALDE
jgi:putative PIN family toxin of toxin-antitoxin system